MAFDSHLIPKMGASGDLRFGLRPSDGLARLLLGASLSPSWPAKSLIHYSYIKRLFAIGLRWCLGALQDHAPTSIAVHDVSRCGWICPEVGQPSDDLP
jgi:hypothetical protein